MDRNLFLEELKKHNIILTPLQETQLYKYMELLKFWNTKINLTSIIDEKDILEKHFFDSLTIAFENNNLDISNQSLCDVGCGAGFPSIPLKIVFPDLKITCIDSTKKKIDFINLVVKELELKNIFPIHSRIEEYSTNHEEEFDLVVSRAVSRLNMILELSSKITKINGYIVSYKGSNAKEEVDEAKNAEKILFLKLTENQKVVLPFSNATRYNLIYRKTKKTDNIYPRSYSKIKSKPL